MAQVQNVKPLCYAKAEILWDTEHNEDTQGSQEIPYYTTSPFEICHLKIMQTWSKI